MSSSNCCFLICIQVFQEAGQVVWYSHLIKNCPQFVVIHTVNGFSVVSEAEVDVFLEFSCFFWASLHHHVYTRLMTLRTSAHAVHVDLSDLTSLPSHWLGPREKPDLHAASWFPSGGIEGPWLGRSGTSAPAWVPIMPSLTCIQISGQTFASPGIQVAGHHPQELRMHTSHEAHV